MLNRHSTYIHTPEEALLHVSVMNSFSTLTLTSANSCYQFKGQKHLLTMTLKPLFEFFVITPPFL